MGNTKEIPGNFIDDDKNGYVDDVHGWNFLGDAYDEQLEYVRLIKSDVDFNGKDEAQAKYNEELTKAKQNMMRYEGLLNQVEGAHKILETYFLMDNYTEADVNSLISKDTIVTQAAKFAKQIYGYGLESLTDAIKELQGGIDIFQIELI